MDTFKDEPVRFLFTQAFIMLQVHIWLYIRKTIKIFPLVIFMIMKNKLPLGYNYLLTQ